MPEFVRIDGLKRYFDVSAPWLVRQIEGRPRQIVQAVDGIDITIAKGETFSLVGESGCGKSTVARLVVGLYPPTAGKIVFDGNDMATSRNQAGHSALRRRLQMIFQDPFASLNPRWRVFDIIAEPIRAFDLARDKADLRLQVDELLRQVRLTPADGVKFPHEFSGGQRQRISIARALAPPGVPGVRRADLGARRLGAGADPQPDDGPAAPAPAHLSVHQPQSRGRLSHLDAGRRDVPRPLVEQAPTETLFRRPKHPYTRMLLDTIPDLDMTGRQRAPVGGRGAEPDQSADRLHLPSALPVRQRPLQGRAARRRCRSRAARWRAMRSRKAAPDRGAELREGLLVG
jgi:peptide/nickel transport system ATP-binding protein